MKERLAVIAGLALVLTLARVEADDPVSTSVSFNREIIRIVQRKCEPCHFSGGLAMSLSNYRDARAWGRAIREELVEHRMPPAVVARGYGRYETDPSLTAREMATFLTWLDGGMPRGDDADLPPISTVAEADIDAEGAGALRLALPAQTVPAGQEVVVRRVTIDAGAAGGRAIARVQIRPGNRRVLRGALAFLGNADRFGQANHIPSVAEAKGNGGRDRTGLWIGGWLPWQHAVVPPQTHPFNLPTSATLILELYYRGTDSEPQVDRSVVDIVFASGTGPRHIEDIVLETMPAPQRAGRSTTRVRGSKTLSQPTTIWAIQPIAEPSVSSMEVRAERPDGSSEVLMWIPKVRSEWPLALVMQKPVVLPAGSTISLVAETTGAARLAAAPSVTLSVLR